MRRVRSGSVLQSVLAVSLALTVVLVVAAVGGASDTVVGTFGTQTGALGGQVSSGTGVAVNRSGVGGGATGNVFVSSKDNNRVDEFTSDGVFVKAFGHDVVASGQHDLGVAPEVCRVVSSPADVCKAGTASGAAGAINAPEGVTVDPATGNVFVADQGNRRIDVFSQDGSFQGAFGWSVNAAAPAAELQFCTTATGCQAGTSTALGGGFASLQQGAIAIDPTNGNVLVGDLTNNRVNEFDLTLNGSNQVTDAAFVRAYGWDIVASGENNTGANETQVVTLAPTITGGTFTLRYIDFTQSSPIPWNASPAAVESALEAFPAIGTDNVAVTSPNPGGGSQPGGPYTVVFQNALAHTDVPGLTAVVSLLQGLPRTVTVTNPVPGGGVEICKPVSSPVDVCKAGRPGRTTARSRRGASRSTPLARPSSPVPIGCRSLTRMGRLSRASGRTPASAGSARRRMSIT